VESGPKAIKASKRVRERERERARERKRENIYKRIELLDAKTA
jgi:hypothetical protein